MWFCHFERGKKSYALGPPRAGSSWGRNEPWPPGILPCPDSPRYLRFIEQVRKEYNGKVVIVIDEMDKVHDPERGQGAIDEVKGSLSAEGTFYRFWRMRRICFIRPRI
uniref:Uncharacterized protein n=1 Tax=Candidatus Kentrum sp. LFY TaxID=2126342 RepID=A0A450W8K4_9GAMM|nr:MAG: hypothetical protein BECKLFY1418C_GA0070996_100320 [Candidatus Kentron sp. LFY]